MRDELELRPYQLRSIDYILDKKRCGLALDMGLGKTISSLTAFVKLHNVKVKKLLIIAPLNVAKNVWHNEILKWGHTKHLTYSICTGDESVRLKALKSDVDVYIINQENIKWMFEKGFNKYGMIIIDESQGFKNHASKRFGYLKKFISRYMVLLTGTPMPKSYMDMWSQQYLIDKGELLGKNITAYRDEYFIYNSRRFEYRCIYSEEISNLLKNNWLSMKSEDYLELPDKIFNSVSVEIDNYDNKLDALEEIISNYPDENILVAFNFKCDEIRIKDRFKNAIALTSGNIGEVEKQWNNKEIKLLLCQCSTAKGLNLQHGGRLIVWFGLTWNMESYKQFNARLHRQGQTKPVIIYHLVASKCMDEKVLKMLEVKDLNQEELIKILKNMQVSQIGINLIKKIEGFAPVLYKCEAKKDTIGYGHIIRKTDNIVQSLNKSQAETLLHKDILPFENAVNLLVTVPLTQNQFDALVCFAFNIGLSAFQTSTLLKLLNKNHYDAVPVQMKRWDKITVDGKKIPSQGLKNRRKAEIELWISK